MITYFFVSVLLLMLLVQGSTAMQVSRTKFTTARILDRADRHFD